jgi:spore coat protein A, manganese oxidase
MLDTNSLNVYAGLAGFYFVRDKLDTGRPDNPLRLPAYPYELPLLLQDRMFKENGELFYPAFRGDPNYADFITNEGAEIDPDAPTVLAEFFGDHMVVNGKIWPKKYVEPRKYRLRLLNGCDSRHLVVQFVVLGDQSELYPVDFDIIGGDQGLADDVTTMNLVVLAPATRLDIIVDFAAYAGQKILLTNQGGDKAFNGDIPGPQLFDHTNQIMLFDVSLEFDASVPDEYQFETTTNPDIGPAVRTRRLGLFEGKDEYGRLQPLLGTVDPAYDRKIKPIYYPDLAMYADAGLRPNNQMIGALPWHAPTTENIRLNDVEEWEIWNLTGDVHPIHL